MKANMIMQALFTLIRLDSGIYTVKFRRMTQETLDGKVAVR